MWWMNEHELRDAVKKHCGDKMENEEKICKPCAKKLSRAKKIEWQKEDLWRKHRRGFFRKPSETKPRPENHYLDPKDE